MRPKVEGKGPKYSSRGGGGVFAGVRNKQDEGKGWMNGEQGKVVGEYEQLVTLLREWRLVKPV